MTVRDAGKWSFHCFCVGNGSKNFGLELWWNSNRFGIGGNFWTWEFLAMREWK